MGNHLVHRWELMGQGDPLLMLVRGPRAPGRTRRLRGFPSRRESTGPLVDLDG